MRIIKRKTIIVWIIIISLLLLVEIALIVFFTTKKTDFPQNTQEVFATGFEESTSLTQEQFSSEASSSLDETTLPVGTDDKTSHVEITESAQTSTYPANQNQSSQNFPEQGSNSEEKPNEESTEDSSEMTSETQAATETPSSTESATEATTVAENHEQSPEKSETDPSDKTAVDDNFGETDWD